MALRWFGPFVRWHVRRKIVRAWRDFLDRAGVTEGEVRTMLDGKKTHILSWSAAITAAIGIVTRVLTGEMDIAGALSEAWTVLMPLAVSAFRAAKTPTAAVPASTP